MAIVRSWTQYLAGVGTPVERACRRAGLPFHALDDINSYVPSHCFWSLVFETAMAEQIPDLGFRVGCFRGANSAEPAMRRLLDKAPTLYLGLRRGSELMNGTVTNCRIGLKPTPDGESMYFYHWPSCRGGNPAIEQIGGFGLMTLLDMVREYTGRDWQPARVGIISSREPTDFVRACFPSTQFVQTRDCSYIVLPNKLLSLPPCTFESNDEGVDLGSINFHDGEFADQLKSVLRAYVREPELKLGAFARLIGMSPRNLQRRLEEYGTSYSQLLDEVRFDVGTRMLMDSELRIADVARELGFRRATHFSRSFRRIAGVSPREYRSHQLPEAKAS